VTNERPGRRNYYSRPFAILWLTLLLTNGVEAERSAGAFRWVFLFVEVGLALSAVDIVYSAVTRNPARRFRQRM
jgi:hypothetical protein